MWSTRSKTIRNGGENRFAELTREVGFSTRDDWWIDTIGVGAY